MNATMFYLFAQYSNWQRMGDGLYRGRGATEQGEWVLYLFAAVLLAIVGAIIYAHRRANELTQPCDDPGKLFQELCRAHQIDRRSKRLLKHLAECRALSQPAEVFVTPSAFEPGDLPLPLQAKASQLRELRQRLF